jgi:hypothetical protein
MEEIVGIGKVDWKTTWQICECSKKSGKFPTGKCKWCKIVVMDA